MGRGRRRSSFDERRQESGRSVREQEEVDRENSNNGDSPDKIPYRLTDDEAKWNFGFDRD